MSEFFSVILEAAVVLFPATLMALMAASTKERGEVITVKPAPTVAGTASSTASAPS